MTPKNSLRITLCLCTVVLLLVGSVREITAGKSTAQALITDRANLPVSNQFGPPGPVRLCDSGDVFFAPRFSFFHWDAITGNRTRLLQASDPHPGFPGSVMDIVGSNLQINSTGHAVMVNFFARKGERSPRGIFVYDGTSFLKVVMRGEVAPGTGGEVFANFNQILLNDLDQVAFVGTIEPTNFLGGIFVGSPTGPPAKVAIIGETAPGTGGGTYNGFQLVGFNDAGQVAFISGILGGTTNRALFIGTTSGVVKVAANGDPAPGTTGIFSFFGGTINFAMNESGQAAFLTAVPGDPVANRGIWVGDGSGPPSKLVAHGDATGTGLGGTFSGITPNMFGFNDSGKAIFRSDLAGATTDHALFIKDLANPAQVVFARGDAAPGGTTEIFDLSQQVRLNNNDKVAFLASLQGGPSPFGWFLGSGGAPPVKIVLEGEASPIGGTFGLASGNVQINNNDQAIFIADILGPNIIGTFLWTPASSIVSIVNTNDTLPAGANTIIRTFMPGASDDRLLFHAFNAGGRFTTFTKPLHPGGGGVTRIVGEGDAAPGIGGAMWGIGPNFGLINDNEEAVFHSFVIGASAYPAFGIFTHKPGMGLQKLVATGDPAPGGNGGTFLNPSGDQNPPARINNLGQVAFFSPVAVGSTIEPGLFIGSVAGGIQPLARVGDASPIGGTFVNFNANNLSLNESGQVAFLAISQVVGPPQVPGIYVGTGGGPPAKVVARGDAGPGGSTFAGIPGIFHMNNAGQVAYVAGLTGGPSPRGLFLGTAGGPQTPVALVGDTAPGTGGGAFSNFRDPDIELNNPGQVAFWAEVSGSTATSGYFIGSATGPPAARLIEGQPLPGGGAAGFVLQGQNNFIGELFSLTDSGEMSMFVINITGAPNLSRYVIADPTGALRELAASSEKAQGTGSLFGVLFQTVATNSQGRFFFTAILVDGPAEWGIFRDQ